MPRHIRVKWLKNKVKEKILERTQMICYRLIHFTPGKIFELNFSGLGALGKLSSGRRKCCCSLQHTSFMWEAHWQWGLDRWRLVGGKISNPSFQSWLGKVFWGEVCLQALWNTKILTQWLWNQGKRSEILMVNLRMVWPKSLVLLEARGIFWSGIRGKKFGEMGKTQKILIIWQHLFP